MDHCQNHHKRGIELAWSEALQQVRDYKVSFPQMARTAECAVEGCREGAKSRSKLRVHFIRHHVQNKIIILEEGNNPHPH